MTNQPTRQGWGVLALIVPWGIVGMAVNLTQGSGSPAMIWVWAAGAIVASAVAIPYALKTIRRVAR
jgi:hypothetical protein